MIKISFLSDTHLGFDLPLRPRVKKRRRGEDFFANTRMVFEQAIAGKTDLIVHGGDLFFRSKVPSAIIDRVYTMLFEYAEAGVPIIIVPGNHERSVLPQSILLNHPNLYIFRQAESFEFEIRGQKIAISGFPNQRNGIRSNFAQLQRGLEIEENKLNILVMHQAVDGCRVAGYIFRGDSDTVNIAEINKQFDLVLCGHIHRRQILTNLRQPIIYAGSVERTSFQEKDEPKGYYEIMMKKQMNKWKMNKIKFCELPSRIMLDINLDKIINSDDWEKELRDELSGYAQDSIIRLKIKDKTKISDIDRLSASSLRRIFPDSMNYSLSNSIFKRND